MFHVGVLLFITSFGPAWSVQTGLSSRSLRVGTVRNQEKILNNESSASVSKHKLRVHTFNTALTRLNFPESFEVRRKEMVAQLQEVDDDVVCLQEVWDRHDMEYIGSRLSTTFPYQVAGAQAQITEADMGSCWPLPVGAIARIMVGWMRWGPEAGVHDTQDDRLHPCARCTAAYMFEAGDLKASPSTLLSALKWCSTRRVLFPANGSSGVMLLSKKKIEKSKETTLPGAVLHRTALDVLIEGLWIRCTHLSVFPQENSMGMQRILEEKDGPSVILGDLNSGLPDPDNFVASYNEDSMQLVSKQGFSDAVSGCTWCLEGVPGEHTNELPAAWAKNVTLDHILIRNSSGVHAGNVHKTFAFNDFSANEGGKWFSLSDHLGVSAELTWEGDAA